MTRRGDLRRELRPQAAAKAKALRVHERSECTRRDLNPHTLRCRNLNPVGVYRNAARCSETRISPWLWLHLASFRYRRWTIQGRVTSLLAVPAISSAGMAEELQDIEDPPDC